MYFTMFLIILFDRRDPLGGVVNSAGEEAANAANAGGMVEDLAQ